MKKFNGFPPGKVRWTAIPTQFFSDVLPLMDDLVEMKVVLFCFWALQQKEGDFRYVHRENFLNDEAFLSGLTAVKDDETPEALLDGGLEKAVKRGILLQIEVSEQILYFLNTARGRTALEQIKAGNWQPGLDDRVEILPERPNVYTLYEQNIGALTPLIADAIKDAEKEYPESWLREAVQIAVENNARSWRYIAVVLDRWKREGKQDEIDGRSHEGDGKRYVTGKFADFIES